MRNGKFDDIRPYYDEEIPSAMSRILQSEHFPLLASYVYPGKNIDELKALIGTFKTIADFQLEVMRCVNEQVIARSSTSFTYSGIDKLDPDKKYLFISNHRDIMLDSSLLQYILYKNGHDTSEITFGANLMSGQLVIDIGRSNKMFRVERGGNMKEFYKASLHLSEYIRYVITEKGQSVWIAQRNGRTKDGNDLTDQGIIKMFCMSGSGDKVKDLVDLNIVPVTVSYEWEPCDILKAVELYSSRKAKYVKRPGEDLNSILTGILQPKGAIHFSFGTPITEEQLAAYSDSPSSEYHKSVAKLFDDQIISNFRLYSNNYIAYDMLTGADEFAAKYTPQQKAMFEKNMSKLGEYNVDEPDVLKEIFLGIYANPVENAKKLNR